MRRPLTLNRWKRALLLAGLTEREAAAICSDIARELKAGQERKEAA